MSQLIRRTMANPQQQKSRNLETMSHQNILMNNKYQQQQQQVIPTKNYTKIETTQTMTKASRASQKKQHQN